jgi:hypothetical protein
MRKKTQTEGDGGTQRNFYLHSLRPPSGDARKLANAALTQSPAEGNPPLLAVSPRPRVFLIPHSLLNTFFNYTVN